MMHAENGPAIDVVAAAARRRGQDRPVLPRRRPLPDLRGRGDEPRDPARRGGRRAGLHRPPVGQGRARCRPRGARPRARRRSPRRARSTCSSASTTWATGSRARSSCARRRCARRTRTGRSCGPASRRTTSRSCPPTTARSTSTARRSWVGATSARSPTACRASRTGWTCCTTAASSAGRIRKERWVEIISTEPARAVRDVPAQGRDRRGRGRGPRRLRPEPDAHDQRADATTWTSTTVLRGLEGPGRRRTSC